MDRTRQVVVVTVVAAVLAAATYAAWPKAEQGVINLPPVGGAKR